MIEVKNLTKRYGNHEAVSDLSFTIDNGQIYGFLGPNGAGKSTTMNIMTGCLSATSGDVKINGFDIFENPMEAKRQIGYLPEMPPLYMERTPREYLKFVAEAKGIHADKVQQEFAYVMTGRHIELVADRLNKNLSKGYRQRVGIAQAILGDPDIIILDEPTVGLDPTQILEIRDLIKNLGQTHTVIISTHILQEVQALCDHILIISKGKLVACDTPENLEKLFTGTLSVELEIAASAEAAEALISSISSVKEYEAKEISDGVTALNISFESTDELATCTEIFNACAAAQLPILKLLRNKASLEDIFIELTANDVPSDSMETAEAEINGEDASSLEDSEVEFEDVTVSFDEKEKEDGEE